MKKIFFRISVKRTRGVAISSGEFRNRSNLTIGIPAKPIGDFNAKAWDDYKKWPDFMYCDSSISFIVSEKVISDLNDVGVQVEVGNVELKGSEKSESSPPKYFYLCARNGVKMDEETKPMSGGVLVKPETWNGADFCTTATRPMKLFCSYRIVELAREKKWTNCRITVPEGIYTGLPLYEPEVDHLAPKKDWPPEWLRPLLEQS